MENLAEDQIQDTFVQLGIHTKTKSVGWICDAIIFGRGLKFVKTFVPIAYHGQFAKNAQGTNFALLFM